jgi:GNAT superfamily N-acetyltransferase
LGSWTSGRVLDAAAAMEWEPEGSVVVCTDEYRLIRYPDWVANPTFPAAQVTWSRTTRPLEEIVDGVAACVRGWGLPGVAWWVSDVSVPAGTGEVLQARGAELIDAARVLARELAEPAPDLALPADVTVELVRDERTFRMASDITVRVWERTEPGEAEFARQLEEAIADLASWSSFRVVACLDGEPASTGGCTLENRVAQLWGAATLPGYRGRGCYRAVLAERLRLARDHGATLALVKGRIVTSAPILLRAGFADFGEERCYWLPVG